MVNLIQLLQVSYYHLIPAHNLHFSFTSVTCYKQRGKFTILAKIDFKDVRAKIF